MKDDYNTHSRYLTYAFSLKGWENVLSELRSERVKLSHPLLFLFVRQGSTTTPTWPGHLRRPYWSGGWTGSKTCPSPWAVTRRLARAPRWAPIGQSKTTIASPCEKPLSPDQTVLLTQANSSQVTKSKLAWRVAKRYRQVEPARKKIIQLYDYDRAVT